jgi:hypothetical protein
MLTLGRIFKLEEQGREGVTLTVEPSAEQYMHCPQDLGLGSFGDVVGMENSGIVG